MPPKNFISTSSSPTSSPQATVPKKFGVRMLNGRVYGSRRHTISSNPFANVREEPEFVEWGYGGMGSVNGSSNSKYSVLATGTPALLSHSQPQTFIVGGGRGGAASAAVERQDAVARAVDEDDGSGMGWVRRRREERERLAREKEAQERRASAEVRRSGELSRSSLDNSSSQDTYSRRTSTDGSSALDTASTDVSTLAASSAPTTPPSTTDTLPDFLTEDEQEQHILQAIRLSPKHTHHHHHSHQHLVVGTTIGILESDKSPTSETSSDADGEEEIPKEDDEEDSEVEQTEVRLYILQLCHLYSPVSGSAQDFTWCWCGEDQSTQGSDPRRPLSVPLRFEVHGAYPDSRNRCSFSGKHRLCPVFPPLYT